MVSPGRRERPAPEKQTEARRSGLRHSRSSSQALSRVSFHDVLVAVEAHFVRTGLAAAARRRSRRIADGLGFGKYERHLDPLGFWPLILLKAAEIIDESLPQHRTAASLTYPRQMLNTNSSRPAPPRRRIRVRAAIDGGC